VSCCSIDMLLLPSGVHVEVGTLGMCVCVCMLRVLCVDRCYKVYLMLRQHMSGQSGECRHAVAAAA
jgi:hypothetical protein